MRRLRAVFRFRAGEDPEQLKPPVKILRNALRLLRIYDPAAELTIIPDPELDPPGFDADGD